MSDQHFEHRSSSNELQGAASGAFSQVSDKLRAAGDESKRAAADAAFTITDTIKDLLDRQVGAGAAKVGQLASSVSLAADDLEQASPMASKLVRGLAQTIDNYGQDLQGKTLEQLARSASDYTRRKPALVFGFAALAGFVAFRTFKNAGFPRKQLSEADNYAPPAESRTEPGSSSAFDRTSYAHGRSVVSPQHNASSGADETSDGLNALEESMRHAAEDIPLGRTEVDVDVPVFDRGRMPPKV